MTVGPNGSGKSSIVTALSICLGGDIKSLNRQADIQALVNHDTKIPTAEVEIELFFRDSENIVVRTEFGREKNSQTWTVNGKAKTRQVCTGTYNYMGGSRLFLGGRGSCWIAPKIFLIPPPPPPASSPGP